MSQAWLIERGQPEGEAVTRWWDGARFTSDPDKAVRFAREEDARRVALAQSTPALGRAVSHGWADE